MLFLNIDHSMLNAYAAYMAHANFDDPDKIELVDPKYTYPEIIIIISSPGSFSFSTFYLYWIILRLKKCPDSR